jgi:Spy/CpxP family protein refolding chaperone
MTVSKTCVVTCALLLAAGSALSNTKPYAGQQERAIASLSQDDIAALEAGQGWGFAKSAELNGYPGPAHILELADELGLSEEQRAQVQAIFERMNAQARALGIRYIEAEAALDVAFADRSVTPGTLAALTQEAGQVRASLRAVHLAAHLEAAPILTRHQTMLYNKARGYDSGAGHSGNGHSHD